MRKSSIHFFLAKNGCVFTNDRLENQTSHYFMRSLALNNWAHMNSALIYVCFSMLHKCYSYLCFFFSVLYNFRKKGNKHLLNVTIGDTVVILEQCEGKD